MQMVSKIDQIIIIGGEASITPEIAQLPPILTPKKPKKTQICPICLKDSIFPLNAKKYCSKECSLKAAKIAMHKNYLLHRQSRLDYARKQRRLNPTYMREYWKTHKQQRKQNSANRRLRLKKEKTILNEKITRNLRSRIRDSLKGKSKSQHTLNLLGCSIEFLKQYLEKQFKNDWNWFNYGTIWVIDHIKPCASFDLSKPEEQAKCFHYANLQPLSLKDNLIKGDKYESS
jgi:hypothetical protein